MATDAMTLSEYAELLSDLAADWDDEPVVLIGDVTGSVSISDNDGHSTYGPVGYAQELFEGNGVHELSKCDTRFYGAMLIEPENLDDDARERIERTDGGDA
jgi:hypothetical protein